MLHNGQVESKIPEPQGIPSEYHFWSQKNDKPLMELQEYNFSNATKKHIHDFIKNLRPFGLWKPMPPPSKK